MRALCSMHHPYMKFQPATLTKRDSCCSSLLDLFCNCNRRRFRSDLRGIYISIHASEYCDESWPLNVLILLFMRDRMLHRFFLALPKTPLVAFVVPVFPAFIFSIWNATLAFRCHYNTTWAADVFEFRFFSIKLVPKKVCLVLCCFHLPWYFNVNCTNFVSHISRMKWQLCLRYSVWSPSWRTHAHSRLASWDNITDSSRSSHPHFIWVSLNVHTVSSHHVPSIHVLIASWYFVNYRKTKGRSY